MYKWSHCRETTSRALIFRLLFSSLLPLLPVYHRQPLFRQLSVHLPLRNLLLHPGTDPLWQLNRKPIYCQSRYVVRLADCIPARLINMCKSYPFRPLKSSPTVFFFSPACFCRTQDATIWLAGFFRLTACDPICRAVRVCPLIRVLQLCSFFSFARTARKTRKLLSYDTFFLFPVTRE